MGRNGTVCPPPLGEGWVLVPVIFKGTQCVEHVKPISIWGRSLPRTVKSLMKLAKREYKLMLHLIQD
jgi:hypothetical protein